MFKWKHIHSELTGTGRGISHRLNGPWLFEGLEKFADLGVAQKIQIGSFGEFGLGLVVDGVTQIAEVGDIDYTSALVFPPALTASSRGRWLIAGGGDGAAAREALRFTGTKSVTIVDISAMVVEATQRLIPSFWSGCQRDKRLHIVNQDIFRFAAEAAKRKTKFDIIVADLTDPADVVYAPSATSTANHVYTQESFKLLSRCLTDKGIFVIQAQELSLLWHREHKCYRDMLKKVFPMVRSYRAFIEFYGFQQGFIIASQDKNWHPRRWNPESAALGKSSDPVGDILARIYRCPPSALHPRHYYSTAVHEAMFALPLNLRQKLDDRT